MIAFLGMGLLGSNFVRRLRERGEDVRVWNRSPDKARALQDTGAIVCADAADAVRTATRVHLTLSDDAAVEAVIAQLRPGLLPGVIVVDHTTTSPAETRLRAERLAGEGISFQHAPVFMGPPNARNGTGVMLSSGERARFDQLSPALSSMTGKLVYLGPEVERAAAFKLLGNAFLLFITAGLGDFFTLAAALGIEAREAAGLFAYFNPGQSLDMRLERILDGDATKPSWELGMARKDVRLMLEAAAGSLPALEYIPTIAAVMDRFIARGHTEHDWTIIARDALKKS